MRVQEVESHHQKQTTTFRGEAADAETEPAEAAMARIRAAALAARQRVASFSPAGEESSQQLWVHREYLMLPSGEWEGNQVNLTADAALLATATRPRTRRLSSWLKRLARGAGWTLAYLVIGYWIAGNFSGPLIPILNIGLGPLVVAFVMLWLIFPRNTWSYPFRRRSDSS